MKALTLCVCLALPIAGATLGGGALADTAINESRAIDPAARIEVANVKGAVTVTAWDKAEVAITGTLGDGAKGLKIEGGGSHLSIKVETPDDRGWGSWGADSHMGDSVLDIKVPKQAELKIDVVSADVAVTGVAGRTLDVNGVSGKMRLGSDAREIEIDSVSGGIDLTGSAERAHVETVSGNIRARGLGGQIKFETVSGDIDADNGAYREISAGTVSGDITLRGKPADGARVDVETMSGDVHLYLPAEISARLHASSFSGSVRSDFGVAKSPDHGPGSSLDATAGTGAGQVKVESFSGDVEIRHE